MAVASSSSGAKPCDQAPRVGLAARVELVVSEGDTAIALGSGSVPVLGTPRLLALCEQASCSALEGHLSEGRTTVATQVQFDHLAPVPVGVTVSAEATLCKVEGRRLIFNLSATRTDAHSGIVGAGRLTRVIVDEAMFLAKASALGS
jgi:predicted thioesterase